MLKVKEMFCFEKSDFESQEEYECKNKGDLELESRTVSVFVVSVVRGLWRACKFPNKTSFDLEIPPFEPQVVCVDLLWLFEVKELSSIL